MLYILERRETARHTWVQKHVKNKRKQQGLGQAIVSTTWGTDWYYFGAADRWHPTLYPCPCYILKVSIVTAKYFNKLDLIWGYNNVQIKEEDKWKAVFLMNKRLFKPQVMYFGLCNLPGTFQKMMNSIFLGITAWRCTRKLYEQFCNTGKDNGGTGGKNDMIFENSGEAQFVFQVIKMRF